MRELGRRDAMRAVLAGAAALAAPACEPGGAAPAPGGVWRAPSCALDEIARSLIDEPSDALVPLRRWLLEGVAPSRLFEAALSVGARAIPPEGDLHGVLGVHSALLLTTRVAAADARMPLFKCWDEQHAGVRASRRLETSALPELDGVRLPTGDAPSAEAMLIDAWERWDGDDADLAMLALYAAGGPDAVRAPLTRYGARNQAWVGHRAIWTAHALRCLDALGWECAPWVLRSVARAIASEGEGNSSAAFHANLARLSRVSPGWQDGVDDPTRVPELLATLREGDAETCADAVIDALEGGLGTRTLWTALALAGVELGVRFQEDSFGVHELDTVNALRHLALQGPEPDTALLALLQSAAWRPEFRALVRGAAAIDEGLDVLEPSTGPAPALDEVLEAIGSNRLEAARMLASYTAAGGTPESVMAVWPDHVVTRTGVDVHHFKYHAALMEEIDAALPEWRPALVIGITRRGPSALSPPWSRHDEATAILAELDA